METENKEVTEIQVEDPQAEKPEGLSLRDALEVAIETHNEPTPEVKPEPVETKPEPVKVPEYDGPAELNKQEREDYMALRDSKLREPFLRLHKSTRQTWAETQAKIQELKHLQGMQEAVAPIIKALGVDQPTDVVLKKAVKMWHQLETGNPKDNAREYLIAKGVDPKALIDDEKSTSESLSPVLEKVNVLEQKLTEREQAERAAVLNQTWTEFQSQVNGAGQAKYADIVGDSEKAISIARQIGALVGGQTDLSKQFIANAQALDPALTPTKLLERAYLYCGGQLNEAPAPKSDTPEEHLKKSNRAASSIAGRGSGGTTPGIVKKFKSTREAAAHAMALLNGKT